MLVKDIPLGVPFLFHDKTYVRVCARLGQKDYSSFQAVLQLDTVIVSRMQNKCNITPYGVMNAK